MSKNVEFDIFEAAGWLPANRFDWDRHRDNNVDVIWTDPSKQHTTSCPAFIATNVKGWITAVRITTFPSAETINAMRQMSKSE